MKYTGAEAGWGRSRIALAASNGFAGAYAGSSHGVSASVIGGSGTGMERDYDFASAIFAADLRDPAEVGKSAGERAVKRLGARKMPTCRCPVVFDPRVARGFISHLLGSISGPAIARGTSFLKDRLGERIFPEAITIVDDPHRSRGLRSKPFDGEGIANQRRALVDKGVLTTWLLDLRSARQLGLHTTGHAARGTASPPGQYLSFCVIHLFFHLFRASRHLLFKCPDNAPTLAPGKPKENGGVKLPLKTSWGILTRVNVL